MTQMSQPPDGDNNGNNNAEANDLGREVAGALRAADAPKMSELKRYLEGKLTSERREEIEFYRRTSEAVRNELRLLSTMIRVPIPELPALEAAQAQGGSLLQTSQAKLRMVVDAMFRPQTLGVAALRGASLRYETPSTVILVSPSRTGQRLVWTLTGMLARGNAYISDLEAVYATEVSVDSSVANVDIQGEVLDGHTFEIADLEPGRYDLIIFTAADEIHIKSISVGGE